MENNVDITNYSEEMQKTVAAFLSEHDGSFIIAERTNETVERVYVEWGNAFLLFHKMLCFETVHREIVNVLDIRTITNASPEWFVTAGPLNMVMGVDDAAEKWGVTSGHVKNLCAAGRIKCKKIGGAWIIPADEVAPVGYAPKECAGCGSWFVPTHSAHKYCETCRG